MSDKKFLEASLKAHNEHRKHHQAPPLKLNKDITAIAQRWADHLASRDAFQHSSPGERQYKGDQMGENIAMKWTSSNEDFTGQASTDNWYSEVAKYDFNNNSGPGTGHFTQVVWKDSKELGVGKAQTKGGKWLVVANYYPAGNFIGNYGENVLPPKDGKIVLPKEHKPQPSSGGSGLSGRSRESDMDRKFQAMKIVDRPSGGSGARSIHTETKTVTGSDGVTKTIVTTTEVGPDGSKKVTTQETTSQGGSGASKFGSGFDSRFGSDFDSRFKRDEGFNRDFDSRFKQMQLGPSSHSSQPVSQSADKDEKKKKPQKLKDFIDEAVKAHNKARKKHGVPDIKHNKDLDNLAQRWAEELSKTNVLKHSNATYKGDQLGENVATKWTSTGEDYNGQQVIDQWYSELEKYNWNNNTFQSGTGHFSQVVWKGSKEVGLGKAVGSDGRVFVVANYHPAGNVMGKFPDNVFPPKK